MKEKLKNFGTWFISTAVVVALVVALWWATALAAGAAAGFTWQALQIGWNLSH